MFFCLRKQQGNRLSCIKLPGMSETPFQVPSSIIGGILLLLREQLPGPTGLPETVSETLALVGAGRSQAYAMRDRLRELLPTLIGTPGRPAVEPTAQCGSCGQCPMMKVALCIQRYIMANPGSACGTGERSVYSDGFRRFVVGLAAPGQPGEAMSTAELASACGLPLGTLKDWLRPQRENRTQDPGAPDTSAPTDDSQEDGDVWHPASPPTSTTESCPPEASDCKGIPSPPAPPICRPLPTSG